MTALSRIVLTRRLNPSHSHHRPRKYHILSNRIYGGTLTSNKLLVTSSTKRHIVSGIIKSLPRLLKLRYIALGGALTGGAAATKKYEELRDRLPDTSWLKEYFPKSQEVNDVFAKYWSDFRRTTKSIQSRLSLPDENWIPTQFRDAFSEQRNNLIELFSGTEGPKAILLSGDYINPKSREDPKPEELQSDVNEFSFQKGQGSTSSGDDAPDSSKDVQDELITLQMQYQHEIEKLEKENKELRKQILLRRDSQSKSSEISSKRSMRKSPIDMYSEVLDELSRYDTTYDTHDHLPRVVVVGDQSSGKTSVLEMIAQARIFPRGSGEMMTRSPVMVTLSEGPFHIAKFSNSPREYDLSKESELAALRHEVEVRMKNSVIKGQTISSEVISMTVKGPGLQRMVLVDLPGVISTMTSGMASDTKSSILNLCRKYMENPNAIILCIQDGSIDAERSNVTELVSSIDIEGKRTIFVLTKVDMAETSLYNPERIKKILDGKLFPMKAMGYFAVVTGRGNQSDSIQTIKQYEEHFFKSSKLFKDGVLKPTQMTTKNLSMAVSSKFWKMVRDSIEQQADEFKATRYNLETEWRNTYPSERELDRIELFEKVRGEILDELINLSQIKSKDWEQEFRKHLWGKSSTHVFEAIYMPAASTANVGTFNTTVDIKLKQWADKTLPQVAVDVGTNSLKDRYLSLLQQTKSDKKPSTKSETEASVTEPFKLAVVEEVFRRHKWDAKAEESLRILQQLSLENKFVSDRQQWERAVAFMESSLQDMLKTVENQLHVKTGPGLTEQWTSWKYRTPEQKAANSIKCELERLLGNETSRKPQLTADEMTAIKKNLQSQKVAGVTDDLIRDTWHHLYRKQFLIHALKTAGMCRKAYSFYLKSLSPEECGLDCKDVAMFWRVQQMINTTSNALTQQLTNHEARRLEGVMKEVLDDFGDDTVKLERLLTGHRIKLAEDLKRVRRIQEKLEELILCLNREKS